MKILHIIPTYYPAFRYGGPINAVHDLCKHLDRLGHEVSVYTTNVDGPTDTDVCLGAPVRLDGVNVYYFPSRILRRLYWSPLMEKMLRANIRHFDILHLHSIFLWPTNMAARLAVHNFVPYLVSPRGMLVKDLINKRNFFIKWAWIHLFEKYTIEHASAIHMTSDLELEEAFKFHIKLPRAFVIPNGLGADFEQIKSEQHGAEDPITKTGNFILFIGRISWKKGLDRLIRAMKYVSQIDLIIAGNDEENYRPKLEMLADKVGVRQRVIFVGPLYGSDKHAMLKNAAVLVLPSYSENFGNVVLEAMAEGCPVVVTPEVGLAKVVKETSSGVVAEGNPETLGKALRELVLNEDLRRRMGQNGIITVRSRFLWASIANKIEGEYKKIVGCKNG